MPNYQVGRLGRLYAVEEVTFGTLPAIVGTNAMPHIDVGITHSLNRQNSDEKKGTPGLSTRFSRHIAAGFDIKRAYLSPSGTIGVIPRSSLFFEHGMGTKTVGTGSTTVVAAPPPTTTTATVASGANFTVGEMILITLATAPNAGVYPRRLTSKGTGSEFTWEPALPAAPVLADTVKNGVTYNLANTLSKSISLVRYLPNLTWSVSGCVVDKVGIQFDGNGEATFSASGPAVAAARPGPADPVTFTTLGSPVTGLTGAVRINGTAYKVMKLNVEVNNAMQMVNDELGDDRAVAYYRNGRRDVTIALDARVTDDTTLLALAEPSSDAAVLAHVGSAEGRIIAIYLPKAEFDYPETPDGDGGLTWSFKGVGKETVGNDELLVALL